MKTRYKGFLIVIIFLISVVILDRISTVLMNNYYHTDEPQQWLNCANQIRNQYNDINDPSSYPAVQKACGDMPEGTSVKIYNFVHNIVWSALFNYLFGLPSLFLLLFGFASGYLVEIKRGYKSADTTIARKQLTYLVYGAAGFFLGLIPTVMSMADISSLNKTLGWFFHAPHFIFALISSCSGEDCFTFAILEWLFWPIFGIVVGLLIAKIRSKKNT